MTKEDFIGELFEYDGDYARKFVADLAEKFFESNVCIPKGEDRFEYADEMHALAEGIPVEYLSDFGWTDAEYNHVLRIKPSEPIYEWQWMEMQVDGTWQLTPYETTEESNAIGEGLGRTPEYRIEQTKRERT